MATRYRRIFLSNIHLGLLHYLIIVGFLFSSCSLQHSQQINKTQIAQVNPEINTDSKYHIQTRDCPLIDARILARDIDQLKTIAEDSTQQDTLRFGPLHIQRADYQAFLIALKDSVIANRTNQFIHEHATCASVVDAQPTLVTGYFTPLFAAQRNPSKRFSAPIYTRPLDMFTLDASLFKGPLKAPILGTDKSRFMVKEGKILPYLSRDQIVHSDRAIATIIGWMDPIDLFHAQTQGSCMIEFSDGIHRSLQFADNNGQPYVALGSELPIDPPLSWQKIEKYLRELPANELQNALSINPRYIFFSESNVTARTTSGLPALPMHTVAVDPTIYPFGMLGILAFDQAASAHLVVAHDSGSAIRGASRVDLYLGVGKAAGEQAGNMRKRGSFYILIPKP